MIVVGCVATNHLKPRSTILKRGTLLLTVGVHLNLARAKHFGRQFISDNQRFTAEMLPPYEDICKNEMHPTVDS
ncbi:hypothetical protein QT972_17630 [Microcoleus sp. herbarium7]